METQGKDIFKNNPLHISDLRIKALDEAYKIFLEVLIEYVSKNKLDDEQIENIKGLFYHTYVEKKASYFLENKLNEFTNYISNSLNIATQDSFSTESRDNLHLFYYNNKHSLIKHEQYS